MQWWVYKLGNLLYIHKMKQTVKKATQAKKVTKKHTVTFHLITLFPEMFSSYLNESILARAQKNKILKFKFYNPRDFVKPTKIQSDKNKPYLRVDDKPYGGGPGMVMQALPIIKAVDNSLTKAKKSANFKKALILFMSPSGERFTNERASKIATSLVKDISDIIIISGRYEGIDARVKRVFRNIKDISIGQYILTGGELPAMVIIDAISRQIKGVLGNFDSLEESRPASTDVYTRPESLVYKGKKYNVPSVLLSGDHKKIDQYRLENRQGSKTDETNENPA
jgi:tRNA (guanine37-N1)-methyltransferase